MIYSQDNLEGIGEKHRDIEHIHSGLIIQLMRLQQKLNNEKAREYLMQGVVRRLKILTQREGTGLLMKYFNARNENKRFLQLPKVLAFRAFSTASLGAS